jgi:hypothetical protein
LVTGAKKNRGLLDRARSQKKEKSPVIFSDVQSKTPSAGSAQIMWKLLQFSMIQPFETIHALELKLQQFVDALIIHA